MFAWNRDSGDWGLAGQGWRTQESEEGGLAMLNIGRESRVGIGRASRAKGLGFQGSMEPSQLHRGCLEISWSEGFWNPLDHEPSETL